MKKPISYIKVRYTDGKIRRVLSMNMLLWAIVSFWVLPFFAIIEIIRMGFRSEELIKEEEYHKRRIEEIKDERKD